MKWNRFGLVFSADSLIAGIGLIFVGQGIYAIVCFVSGIAFLIFSYRGE